MSTTTCSIPVLHPATLHHVTFHFNYLTNDWIFFALLHKWHHFNQSFFAQFISPLLSDLFCLLTALPFFLYLLISFFLPLFSPQFFSMINGLSICFLLFCFPYIIHDVVFWKSDENNSLKHQADMPLLVNLDVIVALLEALCSGGSHMMLLELFRAQMHNVWL